MDFYELPRSGIEFLIDKFTENEHLRELLKLRLLEGARYNEMPFNYEDRKKRNWFMDKYIDFCGFAQKSYEGEQQ